MPRCPQAPTEQRVQVAAGKDQPWVLDFPLPERPARIQHGKADGFNFGGSLGMVYEVSSIGMVFWQGMQSSPCLACSTAAAVKSSSFVLSTAPDTTHALHGC